MKRKNFSAEFKRESAQLILNKSRSRIKVLRWDKHGVWLCARRLHKGHFR